MSDTEISIDLSAVHSHIRSVAEALNESIGVVNSNLAVVDGKVEFVANEQRATRDRIDQMYDEFSAFVAADRKAKAHQRALSEITIVRQELEKRFGHYAPLRRTTRGVLEATDVALIRQNTMHTVTEELMVTTPGYWLAPALVALTAWITDNRPLAEKALAESIHRDDNKTSLAFALICRRARRMEATTRWLTRYFQMQNPMHLDREVIVMLNGLANGVFGGAALVACSDVIERWIGELEEQAGFLEEQRKRWGSKLAVMSPRVGEHEFPQLHKNSPTAPKLFASLAAARRNQVIFDFFNTLFTGEVVVPPGLEQATDDLLELLVTAFDDEELPLQRQKRKLELIVEEEGDEAAAKQRFDAEFEVHEEQVNFAAVLTNAAMNPEESGATRATQRYAVSRSRQWIIAANNDLVLNDRRQMARDVEIKAGSWKGSSVDGSNQRQLQADLKQHYSSRIDAAVAAVQLTPGPWIALIAGVLIGILIMTNGGGAILFGLVIAGAAAAFFTWKYRDLENVRTRTREGLEREATEAERLLLACLAELVDCRREISVEDAKSARVTEFLESLSAAQFVLQRPEQARSFVA